MNDNPNSKQCQSQCNQIAAWLMDGKTITWPESLAMFQCVRLASRINDLRKRGMKILTAMIETPSGKRVAQYSLQQ